MKQHGLVQPKGLDKRELRHKEAQKVLARDNISHGALQVIRINPLLVTRERSLKNINSAI